MKKVNEFLFIEEAMSWISKQKSDNYMVDKNIFSGKFEVYQMD